MTGTSFTRPRWPPPPSTHISISKRMSTNLTSHHFFSLIFHVSCTLYISFYVMYTTHFNSSNCFFYSFTKHAYISSFEICENMCSSVVLLPLCLVALSVQTDLSFCLVLLLPGFHYLSLCPNPLLPLCFPLSLVSTPPNPFLSKFHWLYSMATQKCHLFILPFSSLFPCSFPLLSAF